MATYDDLASGLNNSAGLSLADALAVRNSGIRKPTLIEQKRSSIANKLVEKQAKLVPESEFANVDFFNNGSSTGLADLAEASLYRAGGNLADAGRGISNNLFGTDYDDSEVNGWSNAQTADQKAGVSLAYRQQLQQDQDQVLKDVAGGNYLDAAMSAGNVAFRTAADSAATLPELAAGAVLAPVAGAGLGVIGRRIQKASETASKIAERYEEIKDNKAVDLTRKGVKEAGKASVLTADIVQQQRNQFKAENNGEEPSAERLAGMTLLTLATTIWQPQIASKLFMPKLGKTTKADGNFRERFKKEIQDIVDTSNKGVMRNLGERVVEGVKGIVAAGGAEAVQEYAQFWAETLGTKMKPDEVTGFFESAANLFADEGIRDQAVQAAFLGGAAGGATKIATSTPGNVVGAAVDTTLSTANKVQTKIQQRVNEAMPDEGILAMTAEDKARKRSAEIFTKQAEDAAVILNEASDISKVSDETVLEELTATAKGKDLNDPKVFQSVKDQVIGDLKAKAASAKIAAKTGRAVGVGKKAAAEIAERSKKLAEEVLTPERIKEIKEFSEDTKNKIISEFENIPQSTTLGLLRAAGKVTQEATKKVAKKSLPLLRKQAQASGIAATKKLADILEKDGNAPDAVKALRESALKQEAAAKAAGVVSNKLTTKDNLSPRIRAAISINNITANNVDQTIAEVYDVAKGEFDSGATVETVRKAISNITSTPAFKALPEDEQSEFLKLDKRLKDVDTPASSSNTEKAAKVVKETGKKVKQKIDDTFELIPVSKEGTDGSKKSVAIKAINTAFVKFVSRKKGSDESVKLNTDQSKASEKAIPVRENPDDIKSKVIASIEPSPMLDKLAEQIGNSVAADNEQESNNTVDETLKGMLNTTTLPVIAEHIGSKDSRVIEALVVYMLGKQATTERKTFIRKSVTEALGNNNSNNSNNSNNETANETTSNEDGSVAVNDDTDTKTLKGKTLSVQVDGERLNIVEVTDPNDISEINNLITVCK